MWNKKIKYGKKRNQIANLLFTSFKFIFFFWWKNLILTKKNLNNTHGAVHFFLVCGELTFKNLPLILSCEGRMMIWHTMACQNFSYNNSRDSAQPENMCKLHCDKMRSTSRCRSYKWKMHFSHFLTIILSVKLRVLLSFCFVLRSVSPG